MNKKLYQYKRFWLLMMILAYLLVGFFYVPKIINQQITTQLSEQLAMQAQMDAVKFNPLTFSTKIAGLKITDANQQTWFDSQLTGINFDPLNLIWGEWKFSDLNLVQPKITLLTDQSGQVLIPALPDFPASTGDSETIDLTIDQISLSQGRMNLQAGNIKQDFSLNIKSIEISHDKFSLADEDTRFDIKITTENDESIALNGLYNHHQQSINTQLELTDWQATTLNQVLPNELGINNQAGMIQASGNMAWTLNKNPLIVFDSIVIQALQSQYHNDIAINQLDVNLQQITIDTEAQTIDVGSLASDNADWTLNWPMNASNEPMAATDSSNLEVKGEPEQADWQVSIEQINIAQWPVELMDHQINASLSFTVENMELLKVNNSNQAITVYSQLKLSENGTVSINSDLNISPLNINANLNVDQLSLQQITPWITAQSGLVFTQGQLNTTQKITFQDEDFGLTGQLSIQQAQIENQNAQAIADWRELTIGATAVSSQDKTIIIDQITLDQANGNIIIDADKNINIQNLKANEDTASETDATDTAKSDNRTVQSADEDWTIKIGAINIKDTSTALIDQSVQPEVKTSISELNGAIKGLSSENLSKAEVSIKGKFNQFSPLSIEGQINPLSSAAFTDIKVMVEDLDLLAFSPYAASYVAFPINGGKLNLELDYSLNQDELRGKNKLLFKQFKLGDKTPAPDAIDLPLKLAVSLLSDMNGEMKIDLPVSGNINDPEFSYGSLVGKAIFKLITNIVASPFKILGALIPNPDPNLSDIQFASGSAELMPSEQNKLNQIAAIMAKKPELNLQLNPHIDSNYDTNGLQLAMLLETAPFERFDSNDSVVTDWLTTKISAEQLATYQNEDGTTKYADIWQHLVTQQNVTEQSIKQLTAMRNLSIKNYLLEQAAISADKVFIEQSQNSSNNQSMVKVGVSQ